jgi:hypothetical protein
VSAFAVGLLLGQLASLSPPGYRGTLSVGDRSEARVHSNVNAPESIDFETIPAAVVDLTGRRSSYTIGYGPRFAWVDANRDPTLVIMNTGRFAASYWTRRMRWTLNVTGSIGRQTVGGLGVTIPLTGFTTVEGAAQGAQPGAPTPPAQPAGAPPPQPQQPYVTYFLPPGYPIYFGSLRASLSVSRTLSRRWIGTVTGFYQMAGGLDFDPFSQLAYPPARGGGGDVLASYALSRRDSLLSRLSGEYVYVLTTTDKLTLVTYVESVRHAFSARTIGTLGAGVSTVVRQLARHHDVLSGAVVGAGEASIVHEAPLHERATLTTRAAANLGQGYNPILADIQWQATATLSSVWSRDKVSVGVSAAAATNLLAPAGQEARVASGSLTLGYALGKAATLQTGVRGYTQILPSAAAATYPPQWVAFVALLLAAPPSKF